MQEFHYAEEVSVEELLGRPLTPADRPGAQALEAERRRFAEEPGSMVLQDEQEVFVSAYADAVRWAYRRRMPAHSAAAYALSKHNFPMLAGIADGRVVEQLEEMREPVPVKKSRPQGSHKRLRAMLRPKWVNVSQAARALSIERSTILSWYAAGQVVLPGQGGGTHVVRLYRCPLGEVNLTLLQHICEQKRALPAPGRRLGGGSSRELVAAATRAHSDTEKAANYSRTCKALSLLERVQDEQLLQAARRSINRLILRRRRA